MAIESSTSNPLRAAAGMGAGAALDDEDREDGEDGSAEEEDPEVQAEHAARPRKPSIVAQLEAQVDDINIARYLDEEKLREIGMTVAREFEIDDNSRAGWVQISEKSMRFAMQKSEPKSFPWPNASNVIYPLIMQATIDFASRTYPALIQGRKVVKGVVYGSDKGTPVMEHGQPKMAPAPAPQPGQPPQPPTPVWLIAPGEKRQRAERIGSHMSWQLLEEMPEWETETDQALHQVPIIGGSARKTFRDMSEERNASDIVSLMNLVWNYNAPSFEKAPRHTEKLLVYPQAIRDNELVGADEDEYGEGMWLPLVYGIGDAAGLDGETYGFQRVNDENGGEQSDPDAPHLFIEQHRRLDLDDDGYAEPYVVTVHLRSSRVVRIVARYDKDGIKASKSGDKIIRIKPVDHYTLIPFLPSMDGGSYPSGWGHLLSGLNDQINTTLNQMFDAGTLQNAGGGFIGDGLGIASGQVLFSVGKFHRVNTKGGAIRDSVYPLDFKGPSPVLFQLLGFLVSAAKEVASLQNVLSGDAAIANAPPTTVLALIEQGLKTYTAIHKRIYKAFKNEFQKLARLNRLYMTEKAVYNDGGEERECDPNDYKLGAGVVPIADPSMITDMQKLTRAQILLTFKGDPMVNQQEIYTRFFEAADFDRPQDLIAPANPGAAAMAQLEMAMKQAELGRTRAAEQKDNTQAYLNLALARAKASGPEEAMIDQQLTYLRLQIEAINTTVRAAAVDHKYHDTNMRQQSEHARHLASEAPERPATDAAAAIAPAPGPSGAFPATPPGGAGDVPPGPGAVASPPGDGGVPAVPGGPGGQLA